MRVGMLVNDLATERPGYTTTRLALTASGRGHEVWVMGAGDLAYDPDESIHARARTVPKAQYKSGEAYLADLQGRAARVERIVLDDLDVLMLRNNPTRGAPGARLGPDRRHRLRPHRHAAWRHRAQRPQRAGERAEQDLPAALSRRGPRPDAGLDRPGRDQAVHPAARDARRPQASLGLGRSSRLRGEPRGQGQHQPDDRGAGSRRLRDGPGVSRAGPGGRYAPLPDERAPARVQGAPRGLPALPCQ